jgi:mono/diheme cytochrome c family protein
MIGRVLIAALSVLLAGSAAFAAEPDDTVARGRYLATAGDCAACHTDPKARQAFGGGYAIASPLGMIYATNISPSKSHGIGKYTEAQFARALRQGVRADGSHLYPAMPYTSYAKLSDADIHALYVYFMRGVAPVDRAGPVTNLPFPFNLRFSMAIWNALFLDDKRAEPDPTKSAAWNRGAYLANALEHCSSCHTPRGVLMQEKSGSALGGGQLGEWHAPNITSDPVSGIGSWSQDEIATYLKTGRVAGKAQAAGGMAEAVTNSLSHLNAADIAALATYVKSAPAIRDGGDAAKASTGYGAPVDNEAGMRGLAFPKGGTDGHALYSGACASCHDDAGAGSRDQYYPSLFHNSTVGAARPDNLISVIIHGVDRTVDGHHVLMPSFGGGSMVQSLSDDQIAAVASYVRTTFGPGGTITAADVATARNGGPPPLLLRLVQIGMPAGIVVVLAAIAWFVVRRRRRQRVFA